MKEIWNLNRSKKISYNQFIRKYTNKEIEVTYKKNTIFLQFNKKRISEQLGNLDYKSKRSMEYPSIGDQLDALYKAGVFPADMAAKIKAVKDKYPKI